ncbi:hypothetical protein [Actinophytocola sp.]|uniref:RCC1 domain-containing protein n=1 Tax=Actinophytocola sp. TaxID=1872138 RepID=UPI002ED45B11
MRRLLPAGLPVFLIVGLLAGSSANAEPPARLAASEASTFTSLAPVRVLDTRIGTGVDGPVGPRGTISLNLSGRVPATATAVVLNVTGVTPTEPTHVTVFPGGVATPNTSNLNLVTGEIRANQVTVSLGTGRTVNFYNNAGSTHLVADLAGYYGTGAGAKFTALPANRIVDSRWDSGPIGAGGIRVVDLSGWVPASATAVTFNLTVTDVTAATFVTAWPTGTPRPNVSNVNLTAGETRPNLVTVALGADRTVSLYNLAGNANLIVDLAGFYTPDYGASYAADCVRAWGDNGVDRQLGTAELESGSPTPKAVATLSGVQSVSGAGWHGGYALRTDGTVWAWGNNEHGQLGNGWRTGFSGGWGGGSVVPVLVLGLTDVTAIAGNNWGGYALRSDGTVWAWGSGTTSRLGNGQTEDSTVPVRVTGLTDVVAIASSWGTGFALRSDGAVFAWGYNGSGLFGNGSEVAQLPVPVRVSLTEVTAIASTGNTAYAVRADGTVWAWGSNHNGQLGNGEPCDPSGSCITRTPVQVAGLTGVTDIAAGSDNGYALLADGTVRAWGMNPSGQLGNGVDCDPVTTKCESRVPVPGSNLTDVTQLAGFEFGAYALRADGTVWAWGPNTNYSLGNDTVFGYSNVPVRVIGLTRASAVAGGWYSGYAIVSS